jgi:alkylated DNA repair protein alkB family protein 8
LPELVERILDRLPAGLPRPDQLTISIYPTGAGIPPHVDSHQAFGDTVYVFSLASAVMMEFRPAQGTPDGSTSAKARAKYEIDLPPRSLLILTGDARYLWEHSIRARHTDLLPDGTVRERGPRLSLTLRPANHTGRCNCPWPNVCRLRTRGLPARVEDGV